LVFGGLSVIKKMAVIGTRSRFTEHKLLNPQVRSYTLKSEKENQALIEHFIFKVARSPCTNDCYDH
jgi:hypothetical protein